MQPSAHGAAVVKEYIHQGEKKVVWRSLICIISRDGVCTAPQKTPTFTFCMTQAKLRGPLSHQPHASCSCLRVCCCRSPCHPTATEREALKIQLLLFRASESAAVMAGSQAVTLGQRRRRVFHSYVFSPPLFFFTCSQWQKTSLSRGPPTSCHYFMLHQISLWIIPRD